MMQTSADETPLARRFAAALAANASGRARISVEVYSSLFVLAEPSLRTAPESRARLAAAIGELVEAGAIVTSRAEDRTEWPPLPRFLTLADRSADPPIGRETAIYPWRPELAWAARLPLRRSEFEALKAIQVFLRDRGANVATVPLGERSLELFGDEKRLDTLRRNRRLFCDGRLSLELLRTRAYAPPFAFRRIGDGPVALVLENVATYHSVLATLPPDSPVGLVIFGGGGNFSASVLYLAELAHAETIREIRYFGDLDRRGLEIPMAADELAQEEGLPAVRPAIALWAKLFRVGRRAPHDAVDPAVVERLTSWLPASLRVSARDVLVNGHRLAQEAVGTELLGQDRSWSGWAGLGPPGVMRAGDPELECRRARSPEVGQAEKPVAESALLLNDRREVQEPATDHDWAEWISAGQTRNWVLGDPVLDWLRLYGRRAGFGRDDEQSEYDPRTDFRKFVLKKGIAFEAGVLRLLQDRTTVARIAEHRDDARSLDKAKATLSALRAGTGVVAQAVLRDPERKTYGVADLLIRSDLLVSWFPELLSWEEASVGAPGLGHPSFHYRAVDIKFHTFELTVDGHVAGSPTQLAYAAQVFIYSEAIGRLQGHVPPAAYMIGRTWRQGDSLGEGCLDRLARVDIDRWLPSRQFTLSDLVREAVAWIRRIRTHGGDWRVLPTPSVPELYPHARNAEDAPWHTAKRQIATALRELTLLPGMNPERRATAHAHGILSWDHQDLTAAQLGITSPAYAARADTVLAANRAAAPIVVPERIVSADQQWRHRPQVEFYVDFETVSNVDDDLSALPRIGAGAQIVQIGCGHFASDESWQFAQWTVDALTLQEERRIIDRWIREMADVCAARETTPSAARICHWSAAEPVNLDLAYNAARRRHADAEWPSDLPWFDVLEKVIRAEPVAVTGAFNFGLKSVAKAMHAAGLIETAWSDGPTDGLGAMVGTWSAARESLGAFLSEHPLMIEIARYNQTDCRAMADVLNWLRKNR